MPNLKMSTNGSENLTKRLSGLTIPQIAILQYSLDVCVPRKGYSSRMRPEVASMTRNYVDDKKNWGWLATS